MWRKLTGYLNPLVWMWSYAYAMSYTEPSQPEDCVYPLYLISYNFSTLKAPNHSKLLTGCWHYTPNYMYFCECLCVLNILIFKAPSAPQCLYIYMYTYQQYKMKCDGNLFWTEIVSWDKRKNEGVIGEDGSISKNVSILWLICGLYMVQLYFIYA